MANVIVGTGDIGGSQTCILRRRKKQPQWIMWWAYLGFPFRTKTLIPPIFWPPRPSFSGSCTWLQANAWSKVISPWLKAAHIQDQSRWSNRSQSLHPSLGQLRRAIPARGGTTCGPQLQLLPSFPYSCCFPEHNHIDLLPSNCPLGVYFLEN